HFNGSTNARPAESYPVKNTVLTITSLGLKEAKELVEAGGKAVKEKATKEEAEKIKKTLEAAGAVVELK
ncbi:MAG: ribosomal protein L7/L12, partial [Spirochaetota bacterium]